MGQGGGYSTTSNSRHFMAVSLLKMHQIFMLAFAGLRVEGEVAQVLVVSQPPPLACVAHNILGKLLNSGPAWQERISVLNSRCPQHTSEIRLKIRQ